MIYIECPEELVFSNPNIPTVFLAGGITNCPDWQLDMRNMLRDLRITLMNPRRANFDITDPSMSSKQILWEHQHLRKAHSVIFWFPKETLCPITLYELGKVITSEKKLFIGTHPDYARRFDVLEQVRLMRNARTQPPIVDSLTDLADQVIWEYDREN